MKIKNKIDFKSLYENNLNSFIAWNDHHVNMINRLNAQMKNYRGKIYLFGGHITTQFYIAFGLSTDKIEGVLDNDPFKHGKRVGGTDLKIFPPSILGREEETAIIIPQSPYAEEIKKGILENHNKIVFWE